MAFVAFALALIVSFAVCGLAFTLGGRLRIFDLPDGHLKTHSLPAVPLGGAGVLVGLHLGLWLLRAFDPALLVATLLVWGLGLVDDLASVSPLVRLVGAGVAGLLLALLSDLAGQPLLLVIWVAATVVVVNAVNLLDGLDGLAASVAVVALAGLWWFGVNQGTPGPHFYVVPIGAIVGFLVWNFPRARMFLGDNGAYVIGVTLSWAALRASPDATAGLVGLAIIGVPILDMTVTVARRLLTGRKLVSGDRDHTYDLMVRSGTAVGVVVAVYVLVEGTWASALVLVSAFAGDLPALWVAVAAGAALVATLALMQRSREAAA